MRHAVLCLVLLASQPGCRDRTESPPGSAARTSAPGATSRPSTAIAGGSRYAKDGLAFQLPDGWSVTLDEVETELVWLRTVDVEDASSGLLRVSCQKGLDLGSTADFIGMVLDKMQAALGSGARLVGISAATPTQASISGTARDGHLIHFQLVLGEVRVPYTMSAFHADIGPLKCTLVTQVSDDEALACKAPLALILGSIAVADAP